MKRRIVVCSLVLVIGWLTVAEAQWRKTSEGDWVYDPTFVEADRWSRTGFAESEPDWGVDDLKVVPVPVSGFTLRNPGTGLAYRGLGYMSPTTVGPILIWAPLDLPAGALLESVTVVYRDSSNDRDLELWVTQYVGDSGSPQVVDSAFWSSSGFTWYAAAEIPVGETVRYHDEGTGQTILWAVNLELEEPETQFKGIHASYRLQVSPAPLTSTFNDVDPDHPFFQYVEALAGSGITAGCGGGDFCPDAPLTRGQMAVFLSKALGLHWSD